MSEVKNRIPVIHSVKVLKAILNGSEKPNNAEFRLAHFLNIRARQIAIINNLIKEKKIRFRPVGKSKIRHYIIFL